MATIHYVALIIQTRIETNCSRRVVSEVYKPRTSAPETISHPHQNQPHTHLHSHSQITYTVWFKIQYIANMQFSIVLPLIATASAAALLPGEDACSTTKGSMCGVAGRALMENITFPACKCKVECKGQVEILSILFDAVCTPHTLHATAITNMTLTFCSGSA